MRSKALSLLKSKMKHSRSVRGAHSQHKQLSEDQPESAATHQNENGASRRSEHGDESVTNQSTAAGGPDKSPDEEAQRVASTPFRSESSCNQREEESKLSIAQLKQQTVVVYAKRRTEPTTHNRVSPPATTTSCGCIESSQETSTPPEIVSEPAQQPQQQQETAKSLTKLVVKWSCGVCKRECIPIREESRCLWYVSYVYVCQCCSPLVPTGLLTEVLGVESVWFIVDTDTRSTRPLSPTRA